MLSRTLSLGGWLCMSVFSMPAWSVSDVRTTTTQATPIVSPPSAAPALTLPAAIEMALERHPELQSSQLAVDIAQGGIEQAGLRPNPELQLQSEDVGRGNQSVSASWVQTLELGGKRTKRLQLAENDRKLAELGVAAKRSELSAQVRAAFMQALLAVQLAQNQNDNAVLMKEWAESVQKRVEAGKASPLEADRAQLANLAAQNVAQRSRRELNIAMNRLATLLGHDEPPRITASGIDTSLLPSWTKIKATLVMSPRARILGAEIQRAEAELRLQQSLAVQDIQLSAGVKNDRATGDNGLLIGISVPLPFSHRNQGSIRQAELRLQQARLHQAAQLRELELQAVTLWDQMRGVQKTVSLMNQELLPGAEKAFAKAREGHQLGKFAFIDVLDAQRTLVDLRNEQNHNLRSYATYESDLEALLGTPISTLALQTTGDTP